MIRGAALLAVMAVALGSCTAPETEVEAYADVRGVAFRVAPDKLEYANCFAYFNIIDGRGEIAWQLVSDYVSGPHETCPKVFPLHYGVVPAGVQAHGGAVALVPGRLYIIEGSATGRMVGAFRLGADGKTVEPADPDSAEARAARETYDGNHTIPYNAGNDAAASNATANQSQR